MICCPKCLHKWQVNEKESVYRCPACSSEFNDYDLYLPLAEHGNAAAQVVIGICCAEGKFTEKSIDKAKDWFEKAAAQGDTDAVTILEKLRSKGL